MGPVPRTVAGGPFEALRDTEAGGSCQAIYGQNVKGKFIKKPELTVSIDRLRRFRGGGEPMEHPAVWRTMLTGALMPRGGT